jgi:hypothetical protein
LLLLLAILLAFIAHRFAALVGDALLEVVPLRLFDPGSAARRLGGWALIIISRHFFASSAVIAATDPGATSEKLRLRISAAMRDAEPFIGVTHRQAWTKDDTSCEN